MEKIEQKINYIIGLVAGYKTYIIGLIAIAIGLYYGDKELVLTGLGFITIRAGIAKMQ